MNLRKDLSGLSKNQEKNLMSPKEAYIQILLLISPFFSFNLNEIACIL